MTFTPGVGGNNRLGIQNQNGINALGANNQAGGQKDPLTELLDLLKQMQAKNAQGGGQAGGPNGGQQAQQPQQADNGGQQEAMPSPDDPEFKQKLQRCLAKLAVQNPQLAQQINAAIPGNMSQGAGGSVSGAGAVA